MTVRLAIDAMGGDHAPQAIVEGAAHAVVQGHDAFFIFYGDEEQIGPLIAAHPALAACARIVHTEQFIPSTMKPSAALRQAKNSSMRLALEATRDGTADATVSAGNTGAYMALAKLVLRTLPGIDRPAICGLLPADKGTGAAMLDLGANVEASAQNLVEFAIMGSLFAQEVRRIERPRIALLNIGSEDIKGSVEIQEAHRILSAMDRLNYIGFVEGNHLLCGQVDVIVCDGFSGNIAIKTAEGTASYIKKSLEHEFRRSIWTKLAYLVARPVISRLRNCMDTRNLNGAPFLGLDGIAVKSHGGADAVAFAASLGMTVGMAQRGINTRIRDALLIWQQDQQAATLTDHEAGRADS